MSEKKYCPVCGKRVVPHTDPKPYTNGLFTGTVTLYFSDSSEPICFGHKDVPELPTGGLADLQKRVAIPKAFQDAFKGEELAP